MPWNIAPFVFWVLLLVSTPTTAQLFDNFRFVGGPVSSSPGTVTSVTLNAEQERGTLSFLNVAGLSSVFEVRFTPSAVIRQGIPVFLPDASFDIDLPAGNSFESIQFFTGSIVGDGSTEPPIHWFRLTRHNGQWSGVFRVSNRLYSINRFGQSNVIDVRSWPFTSLQQPTGRVKVSAVIDDKYVFADSVGDSVGMDDMGHLFALESIHVLDGLSSESLGLSVEVEQIIFRSSENLDAQVVNGDQVQGSQQWLEANRTVFGLEDNVALFVFRGRNSAATSDQLPGSVLGADVIVQTNSADYQLASAHYLGTFIGLKNEPETLQQRSTGGLVTFQNAHWSDLHRQYFESNPLPASKTQRLSFDEPQVASPPEIPNDVVALPLIDSDQEESEGNDILLEDSTSDPVTANTTTGGSGTLDSIWLLFLLATLVLWPRGHNRSHQSAPALQSTAPSSLIAISAHRLKQ